MEQDVTKQDLRAYKGLQTYLRSLIQQREQTYDTYQSPSFESTGGFGSEPSSPVEQAIVKVERINEKIRETEDRMRSVEDFVESIEDLNVRNIMMFHFINGRSWKQTSMLVYGRADDNIARNAYKYYCRQRSIE